MERRLFFRAPRGPMGVVKAREERRALRAKGRAPSFRPMVTFPRRPAKERRGELLFEGARSVGFTIAFRPAEGARRPAVKASRFGGGDEDGQVDPGPRSFGP